MEKDFHFYTIYVLCRANGMPPGVAKVVAYASQHTDDANDGHVLEFRNGGRFEQVLTAHKFLEPGSLSTATQYDIYLTFHFIPGNLGARFQEKLVCRRDSEIAKRMVAEPTRLQGKPYQLHRLGIALHTYADSWLHSDFSGVVTELNDIEDIQVMTERGWEKPANLARQALSHVIGHPGHWEADPYPDEPFREWRFVQKSSREEIHRKNWELCRDAAKAAYQAISAFLEHNPSFKTAQAVLWEHLVGPFTELYKTAGSLDERCRRWMDMIKLPQLGFGCEAGDKNIVYDDREWLRAAVDVERDDKGNDGYERREDFHRSHWKCFHDAAASHRFFVLKELLAQEGIICC
jgi:hypothetical protein